MKGTYPALRTDIRVLPFSELNDGILSGYREIRNELEAHVNSMGANLSFGKV
jgi:hypothetical protein